MSSEAGTATAASMSWQVRVARSSWAGLSLRPELPSFLFLLVLVVVLCFATPGFATVANLRSVLEQVAVVGIVALAVNQVVLAGEIDVSTGSLLAVCSFVYGNIALAHGDAWLALAGALIAGSAVGAVNGMLATYGRVPSIIATVGTLFILRGIVLLAAGAQVINLSADARVFGLGSILGVPTSVLMLAVVFLGLYLLSAHSTFGRDVLAIGGNPRAARTIGLPINRVRLLTFVLSGASCGLAAAVLLGQIGQLQATAATGFELKVIAAIVLGGTRITGGRGSTASPIVGAVLVGVILNALTLNRVPGSYELLVLGALILAAVSFEGLRQRLSGERS
jgi:ribose/xylose/arabinose/galactoside ABC-type transport system permease subunit